MMLIQRLPENPSHPVPADAGSSSPPSRTAPPALRRPPRTRTQRTQPSPPDRIRPVPRRLSLAPAIPEPSGHTSRRPHPYHSHATSEVVNVALCTENGRRCHVHYLPGRRRERHSRLRTPRPCPALALVHGLHPRQRYIPPLLH